MAAEIGEWAIPDDEKNPLLAVPDTGVQPLEETEELAEVIELHGARRKEQGKNLPTWQEELSWYAGNVISYREVDGARNGIPVYLSANRWPV